MVKKLTAPAKKLMLKLSSNKNRRSVPSHILLVYLLILTMVTSAISASKYSVTDSGDDSAEVAAFVVSAEKTANNGDVALNCNSQVLSQYFPLSVSNMDAAGSICDVAMSYDIVVYVEGGLPNGVSMTLENDDDPLAIYAYTQDSGTDAVYRFRSCGILPANVQETHNFTITFTGDSDTICASYAETVSRNMRISVYAEQID